MFWCRAAAKTDECGRVIGDDPQPLCALQSYERQEQPDTCSPQAKKLSSPHRGG